MGLGFGLLMWLSYGRMNKNRGETRREIGPTERQKRGNWLRGWEEGDLQMSIQIITESWLWINSTSSLGCTLQACKPSPGPASRKSGVSSRDINGLGNGGILHVWSKILEWNPTLQLVVDKMAAVLAPGGRARELRSGWFIGYWGNWQKDTPLLRSQQVEMFWSKG